MQQISRVLKSADIINSDVFIACTTLDEANIVACLSAKKKKNKRNQNNLFCFERRIQKYNGAR